MFLRGLGFAVSDLEYRSKTLTPKPLNPETLTLNPNLGLHVFTYCKPGKLKHGRPEALQNLCLRVTGRS